MLCAPFTKQINKKPLTSLPLLATTHFFVPLAASKLCDSHLSILAVFNYYPSPMRQPSPTRLPLSPLCCSCFCQGHPWPPLCHTQWTVLHPHLTWALNSIWPSCVLSFSIHFLLLACCIPCSWVFPCFTGCSLTASFTGNSLSPSVSKCRRAPRLSLHPLLLSISTPPFSDPM